MSSSTRQDRPLPEAVVGAAVEEEGVAEEEVEEVVRRLVDRI
jgi:hypothetical protein